jgi:phage tail-like protein
MQVIMDVNGTKYHLLLGKADWGRCVAPQGSRPLSSLWAGSPTEKKEAGLAWDEKKDEIHLHQIVFQFIHPRNVQASPPRAEKAPDIRDRRGACRDMFGNWYWIAENGTEILVNSAGTGNTSHFWYTGDGLACKKSFAPGEFAPVEPAPAPAPQLLSGLAVTGDHFLVAGTLEPGGILIIDLYAGGPPRHILWPSGALFAPFDMAPVVGGGVWILDRENRMLWGLDRHFNIMKCDAQEITLQDERREDFQPANGAPARRRAKRSLPAGISLDVSPAVDAIAVESLPDGSVLILDRNRGRQYSRILRYDGLTGVQVGDPVSLEGMMELIEKKDQHLFTLVAHDFAFVPKHKDGETTVLDRLYVVEEKGNQAFAFEISQQDGKLTLKPLPGYYPMRLFGGKGLVSAGTKAHYDFSDRWIPLVEQPRPRFALEATLFTPIDNGVLDGQEPECTWHRLMLDAAIPPQTKVCVWSRVANDKNDLQFTEWSKEPDPYRRGNGSELPFVPKPEDGRDTWELLFQRARGRYLQLKLTLSGDGRTTPRLRALRAYYPRFSYLERYLPAVYREDRESASFLDRYLAGFEGLYTALEDRIAAAQVLFDYRSAPKEALDWLAGWFGIALDPAWDETRRRLFIRHAMDFFQYRGTIHGLTMALHLAFDKECFDERTLEVPQAARGRSIDGRRREPFRIVERYRTRSTPGVVFGDTGGFSGPRLVEKTSRWLPEKGGDDLRRRYAEFLKPGAQTPDALPEFPVIEPKEKEKAADWRRFCQDALGFIPSAVAADRERWRRFLERRYRAVSELNRAYAAVWNSFSEAPLPDRLPADGAPLLDWFQFEGVVLAMHRTAHRFTVLVPMPKTETPYSAEHLYRLDLATRVVNLEKPAHAVFDVKFYWNMFRLGMVRLGEDTIIDDLSSRWSGLMSRTVLGKGHLGESFISSDLPAKLPDRERPGCWHAAKSTH